MNFCKVRDVKSPTRANATDAGVDFFIPEDFKKGDFDGLPHEGQLYVYNDNGNGLDHISLGAGGRCLIPSGIHVRLEPGTALVLMNKGGVASKLGLVIGACVVDEDYTGEIHISLINTTTHNVIIKPGQKIVQGVIWDVNQTEPKDRWTLERLYEGFESERGAGKLGSSGTE